MKDGKTVRYTVIAILLVLGAYWSLASAQKETPDYPNGQYLVTAEWLQQHQNDDGLVIVDVRTDKYFNDNMIPGAIRLPWSEFRYDDLSTSTAELFAGPTEAQKILGQHGISRTDTIVLYDSVERDGGATASYVFWVLDILGHEDMKILERGVDGWRDAGGDLVPEPRRLDPILYQAPTNEIKTRKLVSGDFIFKRLGDPYYQIIDVRSHEEYVGKKGSKGLQGNPLKLGHIPTAVNINYEDNWVDEKTKNIKPYAELQKLYQGLDSSKSAIVYCDSGRRSSFSYFILRLMGIDDAITYEGSWQDWANPNHFYPVETAENRFTGSGLPEAGSGSASRTVQKSGSGGSQQQASGKPKGGYVSCGG